MRWTAWRVLVLGAWGFACDSHDATDVPIEEAGARIDAGMPISPAVEVRQADRERVEIHLEQAERRLREADVTALRPDQRAARAQAIERLRVYRRRGEFPHNKNEDGGRNPIWIDDHGRQCAMAYLVIGAGDHDLALAVRDAENGARVADMHTQGLGVWLDENGITLDEAAAVQPAYCACPHDGMPVCGTDDRTYVNACVATTCAGIEVAHVGECHGGSSTTDWPEAGSSSGNNDAKTSDVRCSVSTTSCAPAVLLMLPMLALARRRGS